MLASQLSCVLRRGSMLYNRVWVTSLSRVNPAMEAIVVIKHAHMPRKPRATEYSLRIIVAKLLIFHRKRKLLPRAGDAKYTRVGSTLSVRTDIYIYS